MYMTGDSYCLGKHPMPKRSSLFRLKTVTVFFNFSALPCKPSKESEHRRTTWAIESLFDISSEANSLLKNLIADSGRSLNQADINNLDLTKLSIMK